MARVSRTEDERLIIAYNIKKKRKARFPTSGKCAEEFGVPQSQWSPWETGKRTPSNSRMESLAEFFKCSIEELMTPPTNWDEAKAAFLSERTSGKKQIQPSYASALMNSRNNNAQKIQEDGTSDYIEIVSMLAKAQSRFDQGGIDPTVFSSKMQSIKEFIDFSYRDIIPGKKPSE